MARHDVASVFIDEEEWSGGARSYIWRDEYSYDDVTGELVVERWKTYLDARSPGPATRTIESTTRMPPSNAPAEVLAKLEAMVLRQ
jgi:hypothetical protein